MSRFLSTLMCAALLSAGCGSNPNDPDVTFPVTTTLQTGQSTTTGGLFVRFIGVSQDSRCPLNAICVVAGDANVQFELSTDGRFANQELHVNDPKTRVVAFEGFVIEVTNLAPYPDTNRPTNPADYKVTLVVAR